MLTVQYPENLIKTMTDFKQIPLRSPDGANTTPLQSVAGIKQINTPTEVDPLLKLRRAFDILHACAEDSNISATSTKKLICQRVRFRSPTVLRRV